MRRRTCVLLSLVVLLSFGAAEAADADAPKVLFAARLGAKGVDTAEGVAFGADGSVYVVGNSAKYWQCARPFGKQAKDWSYPPGYVARYSPDGKEITGFALFAPGVIKLTSVVPGEDCVYVAGYASPGIQEVLDGKGGLISETKGRFTQRGKKVLSPREHHSDPDFSRENDQRGVPCVLRLNSELSKVTAATLLEGWQTTWHVPRPLGEDWHQPVALAVLSDGDVVVSHDYGFNDFSADGAFGRFYYLADGLSRLSGDLTQRRWKRDLYLPEIAAENLREHLFGRRRWLETPPENWPHPTAGQTRILRLRTDAKDNIYICGYSPSRTSGEPWWTPFLWRLNPDGKRTLAVYSTDPMSGKKGRLHGDATDSCVRSVNVDAEGNILAATISDGGNSVLRKDPWDYTRWPKTPDGQKVGLGVGGFKGRTLFWGPVVKIDPDANALVGGQPIHGRHENGGTAPAWAVDVVPLAGGGTVAAGRFSEGFHLTREKWARVPAPGKEKTGDGKKLRRRYRRNTPVNHAFIRVYDPRMKMTASVALPEVIFREAASRGRRVAIVGRALSGKAPAVGSWSHPNCDETDGYLIVIEIPEQK
ncbi:MAG: hypothetical protein ACLFV7_07210 [Phycisphaerae bacterium]